MHTDPNFLTPTSRAFFFQSSSVPVMSSKMETSKPKPPTKWALKLAMLGFAAGFALALSSGKTSVGLMIGMSLPFVIILGFVGLLVDYIRGKRGAEGKSARPVSKWVLVLSGVAAAAIVSLPFVALLTRYPKPAAPDLTPVQREILRLSEETNKRLPLQIDSETLLVTTLPQSGDSFVYKYTLINRKSDEVDAKVLIEAMKPQAVAGYKTSMKNIRDLGIRLVYHYSDKDGNFITSFTVGPED